MSATNPTTNTIILNGKVNANGIITSITFEYGETTSYGQSVSATPSSLSSNSLTNVSASLSNLTALKTYHYRIKAVNSGGTAYGSDMTFTTNSLEGDTVTDIDGNVYQTITIGTQVWMAENLKTTKYNDGTAIPNITDNTEWSNLATGAYCWYNNDINNKAT